MHHFLSISSGYLHRSPFRRMIFPSTLNSRGHDGISLLVAHYVRYYKAPIRRSNRYFQVISYSINLIISLCMLLALLATHTNLERIFSDSFLQHLFRRKSELDGVSITVDKLNLIHSRWATKLASGLISHLLLQFLFVASHLYVYFFSIKYLYIILLHSHNKTILFIIKSYYNFYHSSPRQPRHSLYLLCVAMKPSLF